MADKVSDPVNKVANLLAQFNASSKQKVPALPTNSKPEVYTSPTPSERNQIFGTTAKAPSAAPATTAHLLAQFNASPYQFVSPEPAGEKDPQNINKKFVDPTPPGAFLKVGASVGTSAGSGTAPAVKTSTTDNIIFDQDKFPEELLYNLLYENISSQELISISRSDIINGQKILYQPIKNLSSIQQQYNSNNIVSLQETSNTYFAGFSIKLEDKIPNEGNGLNGGNVYIDSNGELIIEFINLNSDEQVEIQIALSGTIYEANLGDYA